MMKLEPVSVAAGVALCLALIQVKAMVEKKKKEGYCAGGCGGA
tara:strand:- start:760 stop:888 length:129 start_codon:yes stop_codon:yes gene_type:complete